MPGNAYEFLRRELQYESHDPDIGTSFLHRTRGFRISQGFELMNFQAFFLGRHPESIRPSTFLFRRAEDSADGIAASKERFEHRFAEILLPDNGDFHCAPDLIFAGMEK